jgi:hypothetical protein
MRTDVDPNTTDRIIWEAAVHGDDYAVPERYVNEAFADYITGQVAGGLNYDWLRSPVTINNTFCAPATTSAPHQPCWDRNLNGDSSGSGSAERIGRVATMLHDMFDGQGMRSALVPGDGDVWTDILGAGRLTWSSTGYGNIDSNLERVILPGSSLLEFSKRIALAQKNYEVTTSIKAQDIYNAANGAMQAAGVDWCDRCRVLALHDPITGTTPPATVQDLFKTCTRGGLSAVAAGTPPVPSLRLDANTCAECPPGTTSDVNGACQACADVVVGNSCVQCPADAIFDAATAAIDVNASYDTGLSAAGDPCPDTLWVEVRNGPQAFVRGGSSLSGRLRPADRPACDRPLQLELARIVTGNRVTTLETRQVPTGWATPGGCVNAPNIVHNSTTLPSGTLRFGTPRIPNVRLDVVISRAPI